MIRFEENIFYTRADLAKLFAGSGLDPDTFIARLKPRKVFRAGWLGSDLLEAFRKAPAIDQREEKAQCPRNSGNCRSRRRETIATAPLDKLLR